MLLVIRVCAFVVGAALMTSCAAMFTGTKDEITFSALPSAGTTVLVGDKTYPIDGVPVNVRKKVKKVVFSNRIRPAKYAGRSAAADLVG